MRTIAVSGTLMLAAGLGWIGLAGAQAPTPPKEDKAPPKAKEATRLDSMSLDEMLAVALQNNADLRVAEAKIRDAQAERDRLRLQVVNRIRSQKAAVETQRDVVMAVQKMCDMFANLRRSGTASDMESLQVQKTLAEAKAKLAEVEAELPNLLGQAADGKSAEASGDSCPRFAHAGTKTQDCMACHTANRNRFLVGAWLAPVNPATGRASTPAPPIRQEMADKLRAVLDKPVSIEVVKNVPLADVLDLIQEKLGADERVPVRTVLGGEKCPLSLPRWTLPLGAWLQMIEDEIPEVVFLVRDYGILGTVKTDVRGSNLPPGAMTVTEFWKTYGKPAAPEKK